MTISNYLVAEYNITLQQASMLDCLAHMHLGVGVTLAHLVNDENELAVEGLAQIQASGMAVMVQLILPDLPEHRVMILLRDLTERVEAQNDVHLEK